MKFLHDVVTTLYDEDGYLSMPRLFCFTAFVLFVVAWVAEQFLPQELRHFTELTAFFSVAMGSYVGKKMSDARKQHKEDEPNGEL